MCNGFGIGIAINCPIITIDCDTIVSNYTGSRRKMVFFFVCITPWMIFLYCHSWHVHLGWKRRCCRMITSLWGINSVLHPPWYPYDRGAEGLAIALLLCTEFQLSYCACHNYQPTDVWSRCRHQLFQWCICTRGEAVGPALPPNVKSLSIDKWAAQYFNLEHSKILNGFQISPSITPSVSHLAQMSNLSMLWWWSLLHNGLFALWQRRRVFDNWSANSLWWDGSCRVLVGLLDSSIVT